MELILKKDPNNQVGVECDGQFSHAFDFITLILDQQNEQVVPANPVEAGTRLFDSLFSEGTLARQAWNSHPKRIVLVTEDVELEAIAWEYLHSPDGFIVLDVKFVRGLPALRRLPTPDLGQTSLHIIAVPSNPIAHDIARLDITGEWQRLKDSLHELKTTITLERVRPPTLEQSRRLVANQWRCVFHFMGHGGHGSKESFLIFEDEKGGPKPVTAHEFIRRMEDTAFLVTLNACVSATPGETEFSNLAHALVDKGVPYALGMRFSIPDNDAKAFSRTFYNELARGTPVENALRQARNSLAESKNPWVVGTPVLYTSLNEPAGGFAIPQGNPRVDEHQPRMDVFDLPRAEGAFQGRVDELLNLGDVLTSEPRAKLLTIHGMGGQGKTAIAREAAERFAHAWPGGVWAVSLENLPSRYQFALRLADFFKIEQDDIYYQVSNAFPNLEPEKHKQRVQQELERRILHILGNQRTLLVLDNAETLIEAVNAKDKAAIDLAVFLRERVLSTQASLLITSRDHLGWTGELLLELRGLTPEEGARLFWQSAPSCKDAIGPPAQEVSRKVEGHPLSLHLLGRAFDVCDLLLEEFAHQVENTLLEADDKYKQEDHRHRTLYACIETSVRYLDETQKRLLSWLWIFQSSFTLEAASKIFSQLEMSEEDAEKREADIAEWLMMLAQRGLLVGEIETLQEWKIMWYRNLPTVRLFAQRYLPQVYNQNVLQAQMGSVYDALLNNIINQLDRSGWSSHLAVRCREDLERCAGWVDETKRGWYQNQLGWVLQRTGDRMSGLGWLERALETAQGKDQVLERNIISSMGLVYHSIGQPSKALELFEQALPLGRAVGEPENEANTLINMAAVYHSIGQPEKALELLEQALPSMSTRTGEATILNNMGNVYLDTGQPEKALELFEQALPIVRMAGERSNEASTLHNMADAYLSTGQPYKALELHKQALPILRELGERANEASTLDSMGMVYHATGKPGKALELHEQALPIMREVGNRAGEASTLNNIGKVYSHMGQLGKALELFELVLPIKQAVGERAGEATALGNIATVYALMGQPRKALELCEQALPIMREVGNRAGEACTLNNMAFLLYTDLACPQDALALLEQSIAMMQRTGLPQDFSGTTLPQMKAMLESMRSGQPISGDGQADADWVQWVVDKTVAVLTEVKDYRVEWCEEVARALRVAYARNTQDDVDFLEAVLAILNGGRPSLRSHHPYSDAVQSIFRQIDRPRGLVGWLKRLGH